MGSNVRTVAVGKTGSTWLSADTSNRGIIVIPGAARSIRTFSLSLVHVC